MFRPPDRCTDVAGYIVSHGWCKNLGGEEKVKAAPVIERGP
jgi:hypothetical protein